MAIAAWVLVVLAALPFAAQQSKHLSSSGYSVRGSESARVEHIVARDFPGASTAALSILVRPAAGATESTVKAAAATAQRMAASLGVKVSAVAVAGPGQPALLALRVVADEAEAERIAGRLQERLGTAFANNQAVAVHVVGQGALWSNVGSTTKKQLASAEKLGLPLLLLVLLIVFGSATAAVLPVALGVVAIVITGALIYVLSLTLYLSVFITNTASMLGLGVAIDYSLLLLARVRQELKRTADFETARHTAMRTAGRTVVFSGATVMACLAGLFILPIAALRSMALGAILVVGVAVLVSVVLLPLLVAAFGERRIAADHLNRWLRFGGRGLDWERWTRLVTRRPLLTALAAGAVMVVLAVPALSMKLGQGALPQLPRGSAERQAFMQAAHIAGPGTLAPLFVVGTLPTHSGTTTAAAAATAAMAAVSREPGVADVDGLRISGARYFFEVLPAGDPENASTKALVKRLREPSGRLRSALGSHAQIGGAAAVEVDEQHAVATHMWLVIALVLLLALVALGAVLRSVVLPLKAVIMNLLSVGAAYGVLVVVFQWGWFNGVLHFHSLGYVDILTPPLIFALVFGLSTDYEVFLLRRIRERWLATGEPKRAIAEGLALSAGTISSAALIMVCVFGVFVATAMPSVKELGLGAAVAIAVDATLVRLMLVPATMQILGAWNWWLPMRGVGRPATSDGAVPGVAQPEEAHQAVSGPR